LQSIYHPEDKLDIEIEEMRKLMVEVSQKRHTEMKKTVGSRVKVNVQIFINKEGGVLHNYIWDPGRLQSTIM